MAVITIPVPKGIQIYRQQIALDGRDYNLAVRLNGRDGFWYLDLSDAASAPIRSGIKIVNGFPLLAGYRHPARPPGELIAVDATGQGIEPDADTLGAAVVLTYIEAG